MVIEIMIRYDKICCFSNRLPETASYNTSLIDHAMLSEQSEAKRGNYKWLSRKALSVIIEEIHI